MTTTEVALPTGPSHQDPQTSAVVHTSTTSVASSARIEGWLVFLLAFGAYITVGVLLDFVYKSFLGDASSRLANGFYVLFSRDPHLAAIGFVWNPLPSVADMPFILLRGLWPALTKEFFAASIVSALCMAGAVYQLVAALRETGVKRTHRLAVAGLFAINPMILYYAGNGMSEAMYIFTLAATARYIMRWLRDDRSSTLVYAGIFLGLAYLTRYEAVAAAGFSGLLVAGVSYARSKESDRRQALFVAATDFVIYELPIIASFVGWAVVSAIITGQPFQQFTSQYGNSAQVAALNAAPTTLGHRFGHELTILEYFAPLLLVTLVISLVVAVRRRQLVVAAPIAVLGGGLAFDFGSIVYGSNANWGRYLILAIPCQAFVAGLLTLRPEASLTAASSTRISRTRGGFLPRLSVYVLASFSVLSLAISIPTSASAMTKDSLTAESYGPLAFIFESHPTTSEVQYSLYYSAIVKMSNYFASLHLKDGSVIVDTFSTCIPDLMLVSPNQNIFVITNDRDFQQLLSDPLTFHVPYILEAQPTGENSLTEVARTYPTFYRTGSGFARLAHKFPSYGTCPDFKLYKVYAHPPPGANQGGT